MMFSFTAPNNAKVTTNNSFVAVALGALHPVGTIFTTEEGDYFRKGQAGWHAIPDGMVQLDNIQAAADRRARVRAEVKAREGVSFSLEHRLKLDKFF